MVTRPTTRWIGVAGAIVLSVLLWGVLLAGTASAQGHGHGAGHGMYGMMGYPADVTTDVTSTTPYGGWRMHGMMEDGMTGYPMMMGYPVDVRTEVTDTTTYGYPYGGWGMHGMMAHGMMGYPMMSHFMMMDCPVPMMMGYPMNATTEITDTTTYGYHGGWGMHGMMGGWQPYEPAAGSVEDARTLAQEYLDTNLSGVTLGEATNQWYHRYTFPVLRDGQVAGMLSVNGYTGWIWYQAWYRPSSAP